MRMIAVIGAGFGDEGKGRTVDDLLIGANPKRSIVVRHNSSAQAGHTVDHGDRRHVFSHFGSGTLRGVPTHLGQRFVVNPALFAQELGELERIGVDNVSITCSPQCLITTPYDTAANQILEVRRGPGRHGSCGVGFGQTVGRDQDHPRLSIRVRDLGHVDLLHRLEDIAAHYRRELGDAINIDHPAAAFLRDSSATLVPWLEGLARFNAVCRRSDLARISAGADLVIFEGAQGLMLDQQHPRFFPHVTRCSTGLWDVICAAGQIDAVEIEAMYVIRPYATRHGAGPLPAEIKAPPAPGFEDRTNKPNDWQGTLRFGLLDPDDVIATIRADLAAARRTGILVKPALTMTCIDQLDDDGMIPIVRKRVVEEANAIEVAAEIAAAIGAHRLDVTYSARQGARQSISLRQNWPAEREAAHG